jgi:hypothetical protein
MERIAPDARIFAPVGRHPILPVGAPTGEVLEQLIDFQMADGDFEMWEPESGMPHRGNTKLERALGYTLWYNRQVGMGGALFVTRYQGDGVDAYVPTVLNSPGAASRTIEHQGVPIIPDKTNIVLLGWGVDDNQSLDVMAGFSTTADLGKENLRSMQANVGSVALTTLRLVD